MKKQRSLKVMDLLPKCSKFRSRTELMLLAKMKTIKYQSLIKKYLLLGHTLPRLLITSKHLFPSFSLFWQSSTKANMVHPKITQLCTFRVSEAKLYRNKESRLDYLPSQQGYYLIGGAQSTVYSSKHLCLLNNPLRSGKVAITIQT